MSDILIRAGCFCGIILLGYVLKRVGLLQSSDFKIISRIVINVTLPASIIVNFTGQTVEAALFLMTVIGLGYGILLIAIGYVMEKRRGKEAQGFAMINLSGCNVGNFSLPFVQSFLGPVGVMVTSLFDAGNVVICFGGSYAAAHSLQDGGRISFRPILRKMAHSAPFLTYIIMTVLCLLRITPPAPVVEFAGIVGSANAFMAMLMIGVGFSISAKKEQLLGVLRVLGPRYAIGIALSLLSWFVFPFPPECRKALAILFLGPVASAAPAFTGQLKNDYGLASAINSFSILISILLIVAALLLIA